MSDSLLTGFQGSPQLQYFIVSRFKEKYWALVGNTLNVLYDIISVFLVYFCGHLIWDGLFATEEFSLEFFAALIYSTTPILLPINARMVGIKARTLGGLLTNIYFIMLGLVLLFDISALYLLTSLLFIIAVLGSAFAIQNIIFATVFLSIYFHTPTPSLVLIVTGVLAFFTPKLGVREVILHKINHYNWYFRNIHRTPVKARNNLFNLIKTPWFLLTNRKQFTKEFFYQQSVLIAAYSLPVVWFFIYNVLQSEDVMQQIMGTSTYDYFFGLLLASFTIFIFTSLKPFLFLGEAERYFELSLPFICLMYVYTWWQLQGGIITLSLLLLLNLSFILINYVVMNKGSISRTLKVDYLSKEQTELMDFLEHNQRQKIITVPLKYAHKLSLSRSSEDMLFYYMFITNAMDGFANMQSVTVAYSYPLNDFEKLKKELNIDTVVVIESEISASMKDYYLEKLKSQKTAFSNEKYKVYSID